MTKFLEAQPACRVSDLNRAVSFYEKLGFVSCYRNGDIHQVLSCGEVTIHLSTVEGGPGTFQIRVLGVEELFAKAMALGAEILFDGLAEREWGMRDFTIRDYDGNTITFCERV